jgi:5-methyltetrahydrofolate--homocysteine methyltransferase
MQEMDTIIKALEANSLRDKVKVLIGGAAVSEEFSKEIGADAYCQDGFHALKVMQAFEGS